MILHIITNFEKRGGAESMLARLVEQSDPAIVVSLMRVDAMLSGQAKSAGVRFISLNVTGFFGMIMAAISIGRIIRKYNPDSILCWMYHANAVGIISAILANRRRDCYWTIRHSLDRLRSESFNTMAALLAGLFLSRAAGGIIYCAERSRYQHEKLGYGNRRSTVIPNGVYLPALSPRVREKPKIVGIAGRFHPAKDYENFFRAAGIVSSRFSQARFVAAGRGLSHGNDVVVRLAIDSGISPDNLQLLGELENLDEFYQLADIFVLSSQTEGFPNVLVEAMSHGVPCVTTDVGDAAMIVGDTGLVVPPRDAVALAKAIETALGWSRAEYAERSVRARARIEENFSIQSVAVSYWKFLGNKNV